MNLTVDDPQTPSPVPTGAFDLARAVVLAVAVLLLCRDLTAPFNGWHSLNDALHAHFARNHIHYGLRYTALYNTWGDTLAPPAQPERYLNHPPLLALATSLSFLVFGEHEWSARLVPILATLGSTALLMTILARLGSPLLGVLSGLLFATLPLTVYFGRMLNHEAPVQMLSLLMVHGYLQWSGASSPARSPRRGAAAYAAGAVLGIGTGWAAVLAAALVWAWHARRVVRGSGRPSLLVWLAAIPGITLVAVVLHLLAGSGWDAATLADLLARRSFTGEGGRQSWAAWAALQWAYLGRNFTWPGVVAALAVATRLLRPEQAADGSSRSRLAVGIGEVVLFCGLQGMVWTVAFKNQSWFHDYWQFFLAPYVALSMASCVLLLRRQAARASQGLAGATTLLLVLLPMPFAARCLDFYPKHQLVDPDYLQALTDLRRLTPERAPVWTSHRVRESTEAFGPAVRRWPDPVVAYYADRPLLFSRDPAEVLANAPHCAAYLLRRSDQPWASAIDAVLSRAFRSVVVGDHHVVFLLDQPLVHPGLEGGTAGH